MKIKLTEGWWRPWRLRRRGVEDFEVGRGIVEKGQRDERNELDRASGFGFSGQI